MSNHSDAYTQIKAEIAGWPQWKVDAYNEYFAISAHAKKVIPSVPTNADHIRGMNDDELCRFLVAAMMDDREWSTGDICNWLGQPARD